MVVVWSLVCRLSLFVWSSLCVVHRCWSLSMCVFVCMCIAVCCGLLLSVDVGDCCCGPFVVAVVVCCVFAVVVMRFLLSVACCLFRVGLRL